MQQRQATRVRVAHALGRGVPADEKGRNRGGERAAQPFDDINTGSSVRQEIVRDDKVRIPLVGGETRQRRVIRSSGDNPSSPALQQTARAIENQRIVIDHDDELVLRGVRDRIESHGRLDGRLSG